MINDGHTLSWGGGFMWIFWILILVGIVFFVISMTKGNSGNTSMKNESPLEILKKRYARGEIEQDEYERRRKGLEE